MLSKDFLSLFETLYSFGQSFYINLFQYTLGDAFLRWASFAEDTWLAAPIEALANSLIDLFPSFMNLSPIVFLLSSSLSLIIAINCVRFIIDFVSW